MIKINVDVKQLHISHSIEVQSNQKGLNILQLLFNKLDFDQEIRKSIQSVLKVQSVQVDINQTISALNIHNYSLVEVEFSKKITIECDHQNLGSIKFPTDAFNSINQFRNYLIKNLVKINSCEILVINQQNGTQFGSDAWAKYGVFKDIKVVLQITNQQKIKFNEVIHELKIDIFQPVAKIINEFKNKFNVNEDIISFKQIDKWITSDKVYKQLNLEGENTWIAEIQKEFNFYIIEESQEPWRIKIQKDKDVLELIRMVRELGKIDNTIPLQLEYKLNNNFLDINNLLKQEGILSYSYLNLIRGPSDNKINIMLLDQISHKKQIERVDVSSTLADLDSFISPNENISYYVGDAVKERTLNLKQLDLKSESIIEYKINIKPELQQQSFLFDFPNSKPIEDYTIHQPSEESLIIKFVNKNTNKSVEATVDSSTTVGQALTNIVKNEIISEIKYYKVFVNNEQVQLTAKFDSLRIAQNQILIYYTDTQILQVFVEQSPFTIFVDCSLEIDQVEQQFRNANQIDKSLQLELINCENKNQTLKDFLIKYPNYKFEFKKKQQVITQSKAQKIKQLEFSVFIVSLNSKKQIMVYQDKDCQSFFDIIKQQYGLPKNQVIKLMVGDTLIDPKDSILSTSELIIKTGKQLTAEFLTYLELDFENTTSNHTQKVQANLEDTLEQVALQNKIIGWTFCSQQKGLDRMQKIKDQPIENNSKIQYQQKLLTFESNRNGEKHDVPVQPEDTLEMLIDRLEVQISKIYLRDEALELTTKIKDIDLSSGENMIFQEKEELNQPSGNFSQIFKDPSVKVLVGERTLTYNVNSNLTINTLKETIYNQLIRDQGAEINKYCLMHNDQVLIDSQIISTLCQGDQVELTFKLIPNC